jgi:hypothetical protein
MRNEPSNLSSKKTESKGNSISLEFRSAGSMLMLMWMSAKASGNLIEIKKNFKMIDRDWNF